MPGVARAFAGVWGPMGWSYVARTNTERLARNGGVTVGRNGHNGSTLRRAHMLADRFNAESSGRRNRSGSARRPRSHWQGQGSVQGSGRISNRSAMWVRTTTIRPAAPIPINQGAIFSYMLCASLPSIPGCVLCRRRQAVGATVPTLRRPVDKPKMPIGCFPAYASAWGR
jgi:hypothetical protein